VWGNEQADEAATDLAKGKVEEVLAEARKLREELAAAGIRVHIDEKDERRQDRFAEFAAQ